METFYKEVEKITDFVLKVCCYFSEYCNSFCDT